MDKLELKKLYYLLNGLYDSIDLDHQSFVTEKTVRQFNELISKVVEETQDMIFDLYVIKETGENLKHITSAELKNCLKPVIECIKNLYLENGEYQIAKVGYLYNSIEDSEIKERCSDILLGDRAFDRAINQATQILENRIKLKAGLTETSLIGTSLV